MGPAKGANVVKMVTQRNVVRQLSRLAWLFTLFLLSVTPSLSALHLVLTGFCVSHSLAINAVLFVYYTAYIGILLFTGSDWLPMQFVLLLKCRNPKQNDCTRVRVDFSTHHPVTCLTSNVLDEKQLKLYPSASAARCYKLINKCVTGFL